MRAWIQEEELEASFEAKLQEENDEVQWIKEGGACEKMEVY